MPLEVILLLEFIFETFTSEFKAGDPCITPNQESATCVPLIDCDVIYTAIAAFDVEAIQFFQASKCGTTVGLVCCGSSAHLSNEPIPVSQGKIHLLDIFSDKSVCGLDALSTRIIGGAVAEFEEFPWLAAMEYESKYTNTNAGIRCGGSIITDSYVLTAAHCLVHVEFVVIRAWLGVTNIGSDGNCLNVTGKLQCVDSIQKFDVKAAWPHPVYQRDSGFNDVGLVRLKNQIKFTDYIRPICLARNSPPRIGSRLTVSGWGNTENHRQSDIKLKVVLPVQDVSICNAFLKRAGKVVTSKQLCVGGEKGKDACQGDSGGPLMNEFVNENGKIQWYQEGIVSYGEGCGGVGRPGIYIRVSEYIYWIIDKIYHLSNKFDKGDPCTTPNGKSGTCVPLNTCEVVFNASQTKNSTARDFAREFHCGYDAEQLVCCESPGSLIVPNFDTKALPDKTACGVIRGKSRICGSEIAHLGEFPWMAIIEYISEYNHEKDLLRCTGSLINNRYVLTAAECISSSEFTPVNVRLGEWKMSTDPDCNADPIQKIPIKETIPHAFYNNPQFGYNNIGLILLEKEIEFTGYVSPVCLPFQNLPSPELGSRMTAAGWGLAEDGTSLNILRKVKVSLVSNQECFDQLDYIPTWQQMCAEGNLQNLPFCNTDVGRPIMRTYEDKPSGRMQWYQEGVGFNGFTCDVSKNVSIITRVASHIDWIINIISEN